MMVAGGRFKLPTLSYEPTVGFNEKKKAHFEKKFKIVHNYFRLFLDYIKLIKCNKKITTVARRRRRFRRPIRRRISGARCRLCGRPLSNPISISRGYGPRCWMLVRGGYSYEPRSTSIQKIPYKPVRPSPSLEISNSIKKGLIKGAVVYGLSAVSPPLGAVIVPSYEALDKIRLGLELMKIATSFEKRETDVNRKRIYKALADASDPALDLFSEDISKKSS